MRTARRFFLSIPLIVLLGLDGALGAGVGVVTELEGAIELIRQGEILAPTIGVEVREGDLLRTQAGASAQLEMDDGSILNAGESSELLLSDYQLEPDNSVRSVVVGVLKGWLRFVTATVSAKGRYQISTQTATIGIRGTEGIVRENREQVEFQLVEGQVDIFEAGEALQPRPAMRLRGGEVYRRARGRKGVRTNAPGLAFRAAVPAQFKRRPTRRKAHVVRSRTAKYVRSLTSAESRELLEKHPRFKNKLKRNLQGKRKTPKSGRLQRRDSLKSRSKAKASEARKGRDKVKRSSRPSSGGKGKRRDK